jgi:thiol oxidase
MDDFSPSAFRSITTTRLPQHRNILKKFTLSLLASSFLVQSASIKQSGLFNQTTDHLRVLNGISDLQSCIDDNPTPYFILFYASWCGHCQHYAPIFKQFTNQTQHWHNVLRVATVDCGASANADACAKAKIQGFPTLTVYNAYHKITGDDGFVPDFTDFSFNSRNDVDLRSTIIDEILTAKHVVKDGKNSTEIENKSESENKLENPDKHQLPWQISWNNRYNDGRICPLQPCFDTYTDIETCKKESKSWDWETTVWVYSKNTVDANTLVLSIGATYRGISAFHIDSDKEAIDIGGKIALPMETAENGKDFAKPVLDKIIELYPELRIRPENFDQKHSENEPEIVMVKEEKPEIVSESDFDEVPSNDFANAISHMINNEIVVHYNEKNAEHALGMISILSQFGELLGLSDDEMSALQDSRLHDANVEISVFKAIKFPKETQEWSSACRGSESRYRGYPCALWRTFHALLASCAIEEEDCSEVVSTIQNYVINFFGCTDCVKNFKDEIKEFPFEDLKTSEEQVLWLWELHNSVNKRLAGDVSEDPEHVKIQFPS